MGGNVEAVRGRCWPHGRTGLRVAKRDRRRTPRCVLFATAWGLHPHRAPARSLGVRPRQTSAPPHDSTAGAGGQMPDFPPRQPALPAIAGTSFSATPTPHARPTPTHAPGSGPALMPGSVQAPCSVCVETGGCASDGRAAGLAREEAGARGWWLQAAGVGRRRCRRWQVRETDENPEGGVRRRFRPPRPKVPAGSRTPRPGFALKLLPRQMVSRRWRSFTAYPARPALQPVFADW